MTVTYSLEVSTSGVLTFLKILFRWRGSVYKALWKELACFLFLYNVLKLVYLFALDTDKQRAFENMAKYCDRVSDFIPLSFILGFYVTIVFNRWWRQFQAIAWPDTACMFTACYLHGTDDRSRVYRRTIARYLNLSAILGLRMGSSAVKKRLPTMEHLVEAGMMTDAELKSYEDVPTRYPKVWVPCQWALNLCVRARRERKIGSDSELVELIKAINKFRILVRDTSFYDWMSIPLIYTQVVTLAVYSFFAACIFGRQHYGGQEEHIYFPVFTTLQFVFFVGWLKVAQCMTNPYGEDDDDFEQGYVFADDNYDLLPPLGYDLFFDDTPAVHIPHTAASFGVKSTEYEGSTTEMRIPPKLTEVVIEEDSTPPSDENASADNPQIVVEHPLLNDFRSFRHKLAKKIVGRLHSSDTGYNSMIAPSASTGNAALSSFLAADFKIRANEQHSRRGGKGDSGHCSSSHSGSKIVRRASTPGKKPERSPLRHTPSFRYRTRPVQVRRLSRHESWVIPAKKRPRMPSFSSAFFENSVDVPGDASLEIEQTSRKPSSNYVFTPESECAATDLQYPINQHALLGSSSLGKKPTDRRSNLKCVYGLI